MAKIHTVLQGKGGVGKSFIASVLAQYKAARGQKPLCVDTDPVNATFHGYKALEVQRLQIMEGDEINPRNFDALVELLAPAEVDVIIDNGASSFVPLSHYLISNQVPALLKEMGHQMMVHTVVTGGQALRDTVSGFSQMAAQFPEDAVFVVWLNPYWGPIEHEGKQFQDMKACKDHRKQVAAIVEIPLLKQETYGRDLSDMLQARRTFDESLQLASLPIMTRQRLKIVRDRLYTQCDTAAELA
ncbi:CobQ/CobB/MinD/ParA family nucleotide binding protein [Nitrosospira sp. Nsp5]|uniref:CobQ/CobB/MinD/ParA nucleotide binding domain-containing protein n=1 Tax=Nitrosospira multiformis TaxID=1231 RepID=A0ABY0TSU5_9PROT|nr:MULTISPECIES: conjugal transfer protein TraL [Nitrosospira]PTR05625.1 CobQ/CobB/MinD/ParA family nucleotide binding protein [Nitrosospira sp. Nsp5]SDR11377.1 CobQ/CobB/MinD/ParA nucleotide binding domain-containing protein [Nitrosospira multiformis]